MQLEGLGLGCLCQGETVRVTHSGNDGRGSRRIFHCGLEGASRACGHKEKRRGFRGATVQRSPTLLPPNVRARRLRSEEESIS